MEDDDDHQFDSPEEPEEHPLGRKRDFSEIMLEDDEHDNYYAADRRPLKQSTIGIEQDDANQTKIHLENRPQYTLTDNTSYYNLASMIVLLFGKSTQGTSVKSIFQHQGLFAEEQCEFDF